MANSPYIRGILAQAAMEFAPPLVRETLLKDPDFRGELGLSADAVVAFGEIGDFRRSTIFDAIREVLSYKELRRVADRSGRIWKLKNIAGEGELPRLELSRKAESLILPDISALSPDSATRLRFLEANASEVNLPGASRDAWWKVLVERALEDDEFESFYGEFEDTPIHVARSVGSEISKEHARLSRLVPHSRRYFERLVGRYDGSTSIQDYASGSGKEFLGSLSSWRAHDGFLWSLLLASHSSLTAEVDVDHLQGEELLGAFDLLKQHGDIVSRLGAIEVGFRILGSKPQIEEYLIDYIERIRDDDVNGRGSDFRLFSALFLLVDGELARRRILSEEPPFYRRLAALTHAALVQREFVKLGVENVEAFCEWILANLGGVHYHQSLVDMRMEPRWIPDLTTASQMKDEFLGRIVIAAFKHEKNLGENKLYDLVLGTGEKSLSSICQFPGPHFFPGPLDGSEDAASVLPDDLVEVIEAQLGDEEIGSSSFFAIVNSALFFRGDTELAELAAEALKLGNHRLARIDSKTQLVSVLDGLARVAAVARSRTLAAELRVLVRRYRLDPQYVLSADEAIRICLVASASFKDLNDWRDFAGDWLTELAFSELKEDEGKVLESSLHFLCDVVPELWVTAGRAEAAVSAFCSSQ